MAETRNKPNAPVEQAVAPASTATPQAPATKSFYRFNTAAATQATRDEISKVAQAVKSGGNAGGRGVHSLNICCAEGNRKSIKLSKSLFTSLFGEVDEDAAPKKLQILRDGTSLFLSQQFPGEAESFAFSSSTSMMVYGAALVLWMVEAFNLDFSNGRTSRSFQQIEVVVPEAGSTERPYAIIDMSRPLK